MKPERPNKRTHKKRLASRRAFVSYSGEQPFFSTVKFVLISITFSLAITTIAPISVSAQEEAFDPTEEDLKGEGLIGPPNFTRSTGPSNYSSDMETIPGSGSGWNASSGAGNYAPSPVPIWQHPAAQSFHEPLSNSRSTWQPLDSGSGSTGGQPPQTMPGNSNEQAWNLWLQMADQKKQASSPAHANTWPSQVGQQPEGRKQIPQAHNGQAYVPLPPPQMTGQWTQQAPPPQAQWVQSPQQPISGQWSARAEVPPAIWPIQNWQPPQVPPNNQPPNNQPPNVQPPSIQPPTFNLSTTASAPVPTSSSQPGAPTGQPGAPTGDFIGGFMNWLGQMPNPFNQPPAPGQNGTPPALSSIFPSGLPDLSGLQKAAGGSFSLPGLTPADSNNPLSSPVAGWIAGAIGSWINQQVKASNPFQLGSTMPLASVSEPNLPNLFPTELKMEAKGTPTPLTENQNILDSELADSLLSSNPLPTGSSSASPSYSSRPSARGPLGIPVPGLLGNALASQRNKFALNYLLNRGLNGSGFKVRLR